jgi:hypothetical protein
VALDLILKNFMLIFYQLFIYENPSGPGSGDFDKAVAL